MDKARAFKKGTKLFVQFVSAASMNEAMRHAYDYKCPQEECPCVVHWRKAARKHSNTESEPALFFRDKKSDHKEGCPEKRGATRVFHEGIEYITEKDGKTVAQINFMLGSEPADRYPEKYLSERQKAAAQYHRDIQYFSSLKDLIRFVEGKFGRIDSEGASNVALMYQGQFTKFGKLLCKSDQYEELYKRGREVLFDKNKDGKERTAAITIVRPKHEISKTDYASHRYVCAEQSVKIDGRWQKITPVIVCSADEPTLKKEMDKMISTGAIMALAARPFFVNASTPALYGDKMVYLRVQKTSQISRVDPSYWMETHKNIPQAKLPFGASSPSAVRG